MLALRRSVKKALYAVIILGLLLIFIFFILFSYLDILRRAPDAPPVIHESIMIEKVDTIVHSNTVDIIARVRNPNPRAGVPEYTITFILIDTEGNETRSISEKTYLLPGSLKYIATLDIDLTSTLDKVRVEKSPEPKFVEAESQITTPSFNSFLRGRTHKTVGNRRLEVQKGIVTNTSTLGWQHVDVTGVAFDSEEKVIGIGKTFIGQLQAGEQREFTIQWPKPFADTAKVIVLPDTNIYNPDNVLPVTGDPALLREQPTREENQ